MNQDTLFWYGVAFVLAVWGIRKYVVYRSTKARHQELTAALRDFEDRVARTYER